MTQRWLLLLLACTYGTGCDASPRAADDMTATRGPAPSRALALRQSSESDSVACVSPWPAQVRLSGVVREEQRYGPPGYGETPTKDERVSVLVMQLAKPIDVCADTTPGDAHPVITGVRVLQLTGKLDPASVRRLAGSTLHVFGTLQRRAWGSDYTDVLIRVDSIPGLVTPAQRSV